MKKYKLIGRYPIMALMIVAIVVFVLGPAIFSLIVAAIIILPMYLAVRLFGNKE
jgi:hypothetical protein